METPKQKAKELVGKMLLDHDMPYEYAKQCALIAVDEVINSNPLEPTYIYNDGKIKYEMHSQDYWQQVKTEIENLV
jgi:hypothetical protein